ncbi:MAG: zinc ribbon domain-containing protein [Planctomycetota bacterium]
MNARIIHLLNVIATGIVVMALLSVSLFWGRLFFSTHINDFIPESSARIIISPSGLVPGEPAPQQVESSLRPQREPPGANEPNFEFSQVYASMEDKRYVLLSTIGAFWDIVAKTMPYQDVNERVYYWYKNENEYLCFDKHNGLIIRHYKPDSKDRAGKGEYFAGPNGISGIAESSLGRFYDPIITKVWEKGPSRVCLYDKKIRRFYVIDFDDSSVEKGMQLTEGDSREPVAIGEVVNVLHIDEPLITWSSPRIWNAAQSDWEPQGVFLPGDGQSGEKYHFRMFDWSLSFIPVLDRAGQIYIYNTSEKSLASAGYLPFPQSLFTFEPHSEVTRPRNVLAYAVCPLYAVRRLPDDSNKAPENIDVKYFGMSVACVSREGTEIALAVFDPNGRMIYRGDTGTMTSSEPTPLAATVLLLLENLQPPVFEVASYLSGNYFEASAGHRALFVLPNSFLGMLGRYTGSKFDREVFGPMLIGPSLILSVWLAFRVRKDATLVGLSGTAKKWWTIGTIAFGLPAYITYRLTRHKEVLVTCQNCGKMRRPDMERCHRCGSKWKIPELTPPNWRICD